jgi:hypothetical protein
MHYPDLNDIKSQKKGCLYSPVKEILCLLFLFPHTIAIDGNIMANNRGKSLL